MTTQFWEEFIEILKDNPCLWDKDNENYAKESFMNIAYSVLVEKLWEIDENADVTTVKNKISWLNSSFSTEVAKIEISREVGINYVPAWNHYKSCCFMNPNNKPSKSKPSDNTESEAGGRISPDLVQPNPSEDPFNISQTTPTPAASQVHMTNITSVLNNNQVNIPTVKRRRPEDLVFEDDCYTFAAHLSTRMRALDPHQKCIAQKLISDVMFLADTKQLQSTTSIVNLVEK